MFTTSTPPPQRPESSDAMREGREGNRLAQNEEVDGEEAPPYRQQMRPERESQGHWVIEYMCPSGRDVQIEQVGPESKDPAAKSLPPHLPAFGISASTALAFPSPDFWPRGERDSPNFPTSDWCEVTHACAPHPAVATVHGPYLPLENLGIMSTIDEKLAGLEGEHGDQSKMQELTQSNPNGLKGLVKNRYATTVAFSIGFGGLIYGYPTGVLSNILTNENFGAHFPKIFMNNGYKGWVVASMEFAGLVGSVISGPLADWLSRRWCLVVALAIFALGSGLLTGAQNLSMIVGGRFISGIAVGIVANVVAIYNCEIAPSEIRGTLIAIYMFFMTFGLALAFFVTYGFHFVGGIRCAPDVPYTGPGGTFDAYNDVPAGGCTGQSSISWRVPLALQFVLGLVFGIAVYFAPYSPRWLMMKGRKEEAIEVLMAFRQLPREHPIIQVEYLEMEAAMIYEREIMEEKAPGSSQFVQQWETFKEFFTHRGLFKRLWICSTFMVFNQWAGINAILYYAPSIFGDLGLDGNTTALLATGLVGIMFWLSTTVAAVFLDKFGRRKMMMLGTTIMTIGHIIVAGIIGKYGNEFDKFPSAGYAGAAFIYVYMIGYGITAINCNVISSEMFPSQHRSQAMGMIFAVNWLCNFAVAFATPAMLAKIKFGTFIVFAVSCVGCFCWAKFIIPETAGKTVEEMDLLFKDQLASTQAARMAEINMRIGLTDYHAGLGGATPPDQFPAEKGIQLERVEEVSR